MVTERATRLQADIPVKVRLPNGEERRGARVRNLNTRGILLEYPNPLRAGEAIGVEFPSTPERGPVVVLGEVAWADDRRAGIRLCGMPPQHRADYDKLLTTLQAGQTLLG